MAWVRARSAVAALAYSATTGRNTLLEIVSRLCCQLANGWSVMRELRWSGATTPFVRIHLPELRLASRARSERPDGLASKIPKPFHFVPCNVFSCRIGVYSASAGFEGRRTEPSLWLLVPARIGCCSSLGGHHGLDRQKEDRVRPALPHECDPARCDSGRLEQRYSAASPVRSGQEYRCRSIPPRLHQRRILRAGRSRSDRDADGHD
jgi:hypothetical protein